MIKNDNNKNNLFLLVILFGCLVSIIVSFYFFYFKKDYNFIVETKCDPTTQTCFYRDCSIADNCPPNNLSYYNVYTLKAKDFNQCTNEDCTDFCSLNNGVCIKTECTESDISDGTCVLPESINNNTIIHNPLN